MAAYKVRLFELARSPTPPPGTPAPSPLEVPGFAVEANDLDAGRRATRVWLEARGHEVRTISCLARSDAHFAAIVYPPLQDAAE